MNPMRSIDAASLLRKLRSDAVFSFREVTPTAGFQTIVDASVRRIFLGFILQPLINLKIRPVGEFTNGFTFTGQSIAQQIDFNIDNHPGLCQAAWEADLTAGPGFTVIEIIWGGD